MRGPRLGSGPMNEAPLMVGVSGVRGSVGKSLTAEVAGRYAGAVGAWVRDQIEGKLKNPRVAIGRDGRAGGEAVMAAAIAGLLGAGCDVVDAGVAMTPSMGVVVDNP